jgi:hypothetical protein
MIVRDRLPPGFLELLEHRARRLGLRVIEERVDARPTYRDSAAPTRTLHLAQAEAFIGAWDRLRLWQDGSGTLRFEGSFRRWRNHLLVTWLVFAVPYAVALTACPTWLGWVLGGWVLLWLFPVHAKHRRHARGLVEALVRDELGTAEAASTVAAEPAATAEAAPPAKAPSEPRVRIADPALAVAVRTSRDAHVEHGHRAPEEEVAAIEREFSRRR